MTLARRSLLLGVGASLGGCGFHALYGPLAGGQDVRPLLAGIFVDVIPERAGQLLRQALQSRLDGSGGGSKRYELAASFGIGADALGIQADTSASRIRINASSTWTLRRFDVKSTNITSGSARATDGVNISNEQYFAYDLEQQTVVRRLAEQVASQIVLDLAAYFRDHPEPA